MRERPGKAQRARQVLVGLLLPTAAPDALIRGRQLAQVFAGSGRKEVGDPVDHLEPALGRSRRVKPEQRDDAVDVDQEQRLFHVRLGGGVPQPSICCTSSTRFKAGANAAEYQREAALRL